MQLHAAPCADTRSLGCLRHHQRQPALTNLRQYHLLASSALASDSPSCAGMLKRCRTSRRTEQKRASTTCQASTCMSGRFQACRMRAWLTVIPWQTTPCLTVSGVAGCASLCWVLQAQVHSAERAFSKAAEKVRIVSVDAACDLRDPVQLWPDGRAAAQALEINLNPKWYGTLAEIGAGQEARRGRFLRSITG